MSDYRGVIIEESLENIELLKRVRIISTEVFPVTDAHQTPWLDQWTLHTLEVPEKDVGQVAEEISHHLEFEHNSSWYADFRNDTQHYVIFRDKIFLIDRSCQAQYDEAVEYGQSLGIPDYQLDFQPKDD